MTVRLDTYLTMLGWSSSFRREISRMAVQGTPSSSDSRRIRLRATIISESCNGLERNKSRERSREALNGVCSKGKGNVCLF
jgi:hypothetical protein